MQPTKHPLIHPLTLAVAGALLFGCSADQSSVGRHTSAPEASPETRQPLSHKKERQLAAQERRSADQDRIDAAPAELAARIEPARPSITAPVTSTVSPTGSPTVSPRGAPSTPLAVPPADTAPPVAELRDQAKRFQGKAVAESEALRFAPPIPQPAPRHKVVTDYREPPRDNERFANFSDNPTVSVRQDPLSTFGVDVDTASYTLARQDLSQGQLPRPDSVRTEEWLNYFDYRYPQPDGESHPFSITTELAPSPWAEGKQLLLVGLQGYEVPREQLPPLNLTFLIDVSGSMSAANKLPLARNALKMLTRQLRPQDRVAIVVYAGAAGLVLDSTPGDQQHTIINALDRLHAGGSTAGGAGIQLAYATARQHHRDGARSRVILLSDGDFNVGTTGTEALKNMVAKEREQGVSLSVLTFGRGNIRDELMNTLAENGNGNAGYIDSAHEARRYLVDQMAGSMMTIAKDVKAQIEFNPARVSEYRLLGYETRHLQHHEFNDDRKDAGEIGAGHSVTALYELTLAESPAALTPTLRYQQHTPEVRLSAPEPQADRNELAFLKLRYKQPGGRVSQLITRPIYHQPQPAAIDAASANLRWAAAVAGAAQRARGIGALSHWRYSDSLQLASGAIDGDPGGYRSQFLQLLRTAEGLDQPPRLSQRQH